MPTPNKKEKSVTKKDSKPLSSDQPSPEGIGKARSDFWKLLELRGETSLCRNRAVYVSRQRGLFHDFAKLVSVLTKPPGKRTEGELLLIADELANTSVCQDLGISPAHVLEVAKRATAIKFSERSCVIREGQLADNFYLVLEGSLKQEKVIGFTDKEDEGAREILFANIVQAINIAAADVSGTSDPYVCVRVGTREERSKTLYGTLQPIWDEVLRVEVGKDDETVLLALYDDDAWGDDDYLGSVEVPIEPLRQKKHFYHQYSLKLEADDRFVAAADEEGTNYSVCGTVIFHLKLTTQAELDKLATVEESEPDLNSLNRFVSGQSFGQEMMVDGALYPFTLNVEFDCTLLRLTKQEYDNHMRPLQDADTDRLIELFSEILALHSWKSEKLANFRRLVHVKRYKTGDTISIEGDIIVSPMFILSGEVYAFKKLSAVHPADRLRHLYESEGGSIWMDSTPKSSNLSHLLQPTPERDGSAFVARLLRGDTIHFSEMLHNRHNSYTTIAATPVEIVASNLLKVAHNEKSLIVHRGEGLSTIRETIVDSAACETLCKREPFYNQEAYSIVEKCSQDQEWKQYKEQLVSNIVFEHRLTSIARGPASQRLFAERKSPDRSGLVGAFSCDVASEPKLPSVLEEAFKATPTWPVTNPSREPLPALGRPTSVSSQVPAPNIRRAGASPPPTLPPPRLPSAAAALVAGKGLTGSASAGKPRIWTPPGPYR